MRIIAVDPGLATGVAIFGDRWDDRITRSYGPMDAVTFVSHQFAQGPCVVVYERWVQTRGVRTPQHDALEVIGALRWQCRHHGANFEPQDRAARKRVSHEVVRRFFQPKDDHQMDACQHAILGAFRHGVISLPELTGTVS